MRKIKSETAPKLKFFSAGQTIIFDKKLITSVLARLKPCSTRQIDNLGTVSSEIQRTQRYKDFLLLFPPETRNFKPVTRNTKTEIRTKPETQNSKQFRASVALCENKKNKLKRGLVGSVPSASPCVNKGFTLIEMIVSLLIFGILSALLFSTFIQIQRNINENRWKNELTEEGVNICNIIQLELMGTREIYYADRDSISFLNREGAISSFCWKDSILFKTNKSIVQTNTKIISFKFEYYLKSESFGESSKPVYFLPVDQLSLEAIKVIDWKIKLKKGKSTVSLKTGVFTRNIRQQ